MLDSRRGSLLKNIGSPDSLTPGARAKNGNPGQIGTRTVYGQVGSFRMTFRVEVGSADREPVHHEGTPRRKLDRLTRE